MVNPIPALSGKTLLRTLAALLLLATATAATAAVPASYQFYGLGDRLNNPESGFSSDPFTAAYNDRQLGVASALNNNGFIIGFWLGSDERFMTHSLLFGTNPKGVVRYTENFIGLSGSDVSCFNFLGILLCSNPEFPYGTRILLPEDPEQPPAIVSAFLNTPAGAVAVPDSLPFMRFPGNFVDENAKGILATTQLSSAAQFGVLVRGEQSVTLADVPWLVAINDLDEPLVIAYDGSDGGCLVYGEGCLPELTPCEIDANPGNAGGNGGREASGNAWGHNKCKDGIVDGNNGGGSTGTGGTGSGGGGGSGDDPNGALLLLFKADNSVIRFRFPQTVALGAETATASHLFPVAINSSFIVLRGDLTAGSTVYEKRLLTCAFRTVPDDSGAIVYDLDGDLAVDCLGGLKMLSGDGTGIRAGTVLGFTLNDDNLLAGNFGYNAAGVGMPMIVNLSLVGAAPELLGNVAAGTAGWELNTITDLNRSGMMVGYGYKDCGKTPEAFYVAPLSTQPQTGLRFLRGAFEHPAQLAAGASLAITPTLAGGSGAYELRVHVKKPDDAEWALLSDWGNSGGSWSPGDYQGEVCFRIEARDPASPLTPNQETVVRYNVGEQSAPVEEPPPDDDTGTGLLTPTEGDFAIGDLLAGGAGVFTLLLVGIAGLARRASPRQPRR